MDKSYWRAYYRSNDRIYSYSNIEDGWDWLVSPYFDKERALSFLLEDDDE